MRNCLRVLNSIRAALYTHSAVLVSQWPELRQWAEYLVATVRRPDHVCASSRYRIACCWMLGLSFDYIPESLGRALGRASGASISRRETTVCHGIWVVATCLVLESCPEDFGRIIRRSTCVLGFSLHLSFESRVSDPAVCQ